jgi:subtilisin family serine protease
MATSSFVSRSNRLTPRASRAFEALDPRLLLAGDSCRDDDSVAAEQNAFSALFGEALAATNVVHAAEAGSTMNTAFDLGTLGPVRSLPGLVGGFDPSDLLHFSLTTESSVNLQLSDLQADIDLYLYNRSGQLLAVSNLGGASSESIAGTLAAGDYYLLVTPWRRAISSYVLSAQATPTAPPVVAPPTPDPPVADPPTSDPPATDPTEPISALPDVAYYGGSNEWNLNAINAPEAWAAGYTGAGVVVAVVDTGVDLNHPDLMSQLFVNAGEIAGNGVDDDGNGYVDDISGWDFYAGDNSANDGNGHGTHVAGTIAADNNGTGATGVAPDATIMPVRVLGNDGSGSAGSVAAGIRYAVNMGADVINLSLGGSFSSLILSAIEYAVANDVLVVAAAGNEAAATPGYPARFSSSLAGVLSVGAYSSAGTIANFSNDVGNSGAVQVDAPGVSIYSTYAGDTYGRLSGTSMATPHVAGLAALALSANPGLTAAQLRSLIVAGANGSISGSDSVGGVNAAVTVAMAAAGQTSGSATSSTTASPPRATTTAIRRFMASTAATFTPTPVASSTENPHEVDSTTRATVASFRNAAEPLSMRHDAALAAMLLEDDQSGEFDSLGTLDALDDVFDSAFFLRSMKMVA